MSGVHTPASPAHWSPEAEQAVLGAILQTPDALGRITGQGLTATHFADPRHRAIWRAIEALTARGQSVDPITVFEQLKDAGQADAVGGLNYLVRIDQCVPSAANLARHASIVLDRAVRREVLEAAGDVQALAADAASADDLLDKVQSRFGAIQRPGASREPQRLGTLIAGRVQHWEELAAGDGRPGIATGLEPLDDVLAGGLKPGRVVVLAARPSVGKTALTAQVLIHAASTGAPCLLLSQEMAAADLADRAVAHLARVRLDSITTGRLSDRDWGRVAEATDAAARLPLYVDDQPSLTLLDIRAKVRRLQREGGVSVVAIDYLQLCATSGAFDKRHHQIEQISRGMKAMAKELGVCVLLLSQLKRELHGEPELDHLKESGAIEEDADAVVLLHPVRTEPDGAVLVLAKVAKNRQGRRIRFGLSFDGATQRWTVSAADVSRRATSGGGS